MSLEGGTQTLSYVIELADFASPGLRAFRDQVALTTKTTQDAFKGLQASATQTTASITRLADAEKKGAASGTEFAASQTRSAASSKATAGELAALSASHGRTATAARASSAAHQAHSNVLTDLSGKLGTASSKTKEWGSTLGQLSTPLLAVGAASLYASDKFGALMEQLHTQAGYSQQAVAQLSNQVLKLSPQLAQTPEAIAQGLYHIASVGIPAGKAIDVVTASAKGANISGANFNDTANAVATTLKNWPHIAGGATGAMGELSAIVGRGNLHMEDFVTNLGKVVPVAKAVGVILPELGSAIDVLTSHGLAASQATTSLRFAFSLLEKPSSTADATLKQIGMTHTQLASDLRKPDGLLVALSDLKSHLNAAYPPGMTLTVAQQQSAIDRYAASLKAAGTSAATSRTDLRKFYDQITSGAGSNVLQSQAVLGVFGGTRGSTAILPLLQNLPDLKKIYTEIPQGKTAVDQLNQSVALWDKTQQGQFDHLKASLESSATTIGKDLGPVVIPVLKDIVTGVEHVTHAFDAMPASSKHIIEAIAGIGVVAGPVLKILSPILKIGQGITGLAGRMLPSGGVKGIEQDLAGHGGVTGGFYGVRGLLMPGSLTNPIAVQMLGALPGGVMGAAEGDAALAAEETSAGGVILPRGVSAASTVASDATLAEGGAVASTGFLAGLRSGLPNLMGSVMKGGMVAMGGSLAAQMLGGILGGGAGRTVSRVGTHPANGAGIGSIIPGVGTLFGAGVGALFGGAQSLFGGNTSSHAITVLAQQLKDLSAAPDPAKMKQLHDAILKMQSDSGFIGVSKQEADALKQLAAATTPVAAAFEALAAQKGSLTGIQTALANATQTITQDVPPGTQRVKDMTAAFADAGTLIQQGMQAGKISVSTGMQELISIITQQMGAGVTDVKTGTTQIEQLLALPQAQKNLSSGMRAMVQTIAQQMADGTRSVRAGTQQINQILSGIRKQVTIDVKVNVQAPTLAGIAAGGGNLAAGPFTGSAPANMAAILATIRQEESGNYSQPLNKGGASGAYQFINSTWRTEATLAGYSQYANMAAYLAPPAVQDAVAAYNVRKILAQYGSVADVPVAWYEPKAIGNPALMNTVPAPWAGNTLTPAQYQSQWLAAYQTHLSGSAYGPLAGHYGAATPPRTPTHHTTPTHQVASSGGHVVIPTVPGKPPAMSLRYDPFTHTSRMMTAAQYRQLEDQWKRDLPGIPMPTGPHTTPGLSFPKSETLPNLYSPTSSTTGLTGAYARAVAGTTPIGTLVAQTKKEITMLLAGAQAATGSDAGSVDRAALTQLQNLLEKARKTGNQQLVTELLKDMQGVTKAWDTAIKSNFQTSLSSVNLAEQLKINMQQLGISPTAKATVSKKGVISFGKATASPNPAASAATDPAYLAAQIAAYQAYDAQLVAERTADQRILAAAKKAGNTKLVASTKADLAAISNALEQSKVDVSGLRVAYQDAVYQAMLSGIQSAAAALDQQSQNQGALSGALATLADANGTGLTALQALSSSQGGLTAAQKALAQGDLATFIQGVYAQEAPISGTQVGGALNQSLPGIITALQRGGQSQTDYSALSAFFGGPNSELGVDFGALASGSLNQTDQAAMLQVVINLISTLAGLQNSVATQTDATNKLTGATVTNTAQMASFGGQVTFTLPGDTSGVPYVAGQSSVDTSHLGLGV